MKIEKAQKHMARRTVVAGEDSRDCTVGVITEIEEGLTYPVYVTGRVVRKSGGEDADHYTCYRADNVRKASDEERAAFFAWLRGAGAELCEDNFARLGGAPRGWEGEATVRSYKVGDRVRLRFGSERRIAPTYFEPGTEVVIEAVHEASSGFSYEARGPVMDGGTRSQVGLKHADIAGLATSSNILDASASMDQRRAVVGKRARIVRGMSDTNNGKIGVVRGVDGTSVPYCVTGEGFSGWAEEIEVLADETPVSAPEAKKTEPVEEIKAGDWVYILSTDFPGAGSIPSEVRVGEVRKCLEAEPSGTYLPILVERFPGAQNEFGQRWAFARDAVRLATAEEIAAEEARRAPSAPKRPTVGDSVIGVRCDADRLKNGLALIARIEKDDRDSRPYWLAGGDTYYHADHTFPLTLDGFRAANAKQREYGVQPEDGDYVAIHRRTDYTFGVFAGGHVNSGQDRSDRVVVITKKPRV